MKAIPDCPDCGEPMICFVPRNRYRCPECNTEYIRFLGPKTVEEAQDEETRFLMPRVHSLEETTNE